MCARACRVCASCCDGGAAARPEARGIREAASRRVWRAGTTRCSGTRTSASLRACALWLNVVLMRCCQYTCVQGVRVCACVCVRAVGVCAFFPFLSSSVLRAQRDHRATFHIRTCAMRRAIIGNRHRLPWRFCTRAGCWAARMTTYACSCSLFLVCLLFVLLCCASARDPS